MTEGGRPVGGGPADRYIPLAVAARRLGVTPARARQMIQEGKLYGFQGGPKGWWKVSERSVEDWLAMPRRSRR